MTRLERTIGIDVDEYHDDIIGGRGLIITDITSEDGVMIYGDLVNGYIVSSFDEQFQTNLLFRALDYFNNIKVD